MDQSQEEINIDEYIQNALAIIHPILSSHTYALFGVDNRDRPELFASSVLIKVDDIAVLVTAAHAICEIEKYGSAIHVGANKSIYELTNDFVRSSKGGDDQLDLAAMVIPDQWLISHFAVPFTLSAAARELDNRHPHMRCIHGFPLGKNKASSRADLAKRKFTMYGLTYAGASNEVVVDYARYGKREDTHLALQYQRKSKTNGGQDVIPPSPKGMSGGGLWSIPDSFNPQLIELDGIVIELREKSLVLATRVEYVVKFLRELVLPHGK